MRTNSLEEKVFFLIIFTTYCPWNVCYNALTVRLIVVRKRVLLETTAVAVVPIINERNHRRTVHTHTHTHTHTDRYFQDKKGF